MKSQVHREMMQLYSKGNCTVQSRLVRYLSNPNLNLYTTAQTSSPEHHILLQIVDRISSWDDESFIDQIWQITSCNILCIIAIRFNIVDTSKP